MNYLILKKKILYKKIYFFKSFIKKIDTISINRLKKYINLKKKNKLIFKKNLRNITNVKKKKKKKKNKKK